jgi:L-glyceraldehyde 3-phosphate reductase
MWPGPYGNWGSRKHLIASIDQSLDRMGLEYVDIFYHHRPDRDTPMEETMGALDHIVRSGRALYVGISQYSADESLQAAGILRDLGTPCLIHQPNYSILERWVENGLLETLDNLGIGCVVFSPLSQGLLTDKYLEGIPADSRAAKEGTYLDKDDITPTKLVMIGELDSIAKERGQSLAQMAIAWVLRRPEVTSALIGASRVSQIEEIVSTLVNRKFSPSELARIDAVITSGAPG